LRSAGKPTFALKQRCKTSERTFAADLLNDLVELVGRKAGGFRCGLNGIALLRMRLTESCDSLPHLLGWRVRPCQRDFESWFYRPPGRGRFEQTHNCPLSDTHRRL